MIFHENRLLADDSHVISCLIFCQKLRKMSQNVLSAAVVFVLYSESRERPIQTIMKVSSKSLNYLPIFFSNSMVDRKVDS